jgi:hypothetical protein
MADYEQQWAAAAGHQERHPLSVKMKLLGEIAEKARDPDEFGRLLAAGCESDDPFYSLLCVELSDRWEKAKAR